MSVPFLFFHILMSSAFISLNEAKSLSVLWLSNIPLGIVLYDTEIVSVSKLLGMISNESMLNTRLISFRSWISFPLHINPGEGWLIAMGVLFGAFQASAYYLLSRLVFAFVFSAQLFFDVWSSTREGSIS